MKPLKKIIKKLLRRDDVLLKKVISSYGRKPGFFFVQIGSNDGKRADPLYSSIVRHNWSGIMVEPVPYLFERLKKTHEGRGNLDLRNLAISPEGGTMKFYYFREHGDQTDWTSGNGLGSFNKEHALHMRDQIPGFDEHLDEMDVATITFSELVQGVDRIDLLHIDTEGYDFEIIKTIDFDSCAPSVILYESACLERFYGDSGAKEAARDFLTERGYECIELRSSLDALAVRRGSEPFLAGFCGDTLRKYGVAS